MYRRRPPRRRPVRRAVRRGARHAALQMLRRANRLMETGQYAQAYPLLKQLADGTARHGMPVRAANLYLRAAHARLEMGSAEDAADIARHAIHLLHAGGQTDHLRALVPRIVQELEAKGYHDLAVELRAEASALLGGSVGPPPERVERAALPTRCASCNGPVRADQVVWIDERSAECAYCGSVVEAL